MVALVERIALRLTHLGWQTDAERFGDLAQFENPRYQKLRMIEESSINKTRVRWLLFVL